MPGCTCDARCGTTASAIEEVTHHSAPNCSSIQRRISRAEAPSRSRPAHSARRRAASTSDAGSATEQELIGSSRQPGLLGTRDIRGEGLALAAAAEVAAQYPFGVVGDLVRSHL